MHPVDACPCASCAVETRLARDSLILSQVSSPSVRHTVLPMDPILGLTHAQFILNNQASQPERPSPSVRLAMSHPIGRESRKQINHVFIIWIGFYMLSDGIGTDNADYAKQRKRKWSRRSLRYQQRYQHKKRVCRKACFAPQKLSVHL